MHLRSLWAFAALLVLWARPSNAQNKTGYCFDCAVDGARGRLLVAAGNVGTHVYDIRGKVPRYVLTLPAAAGYHRNLKAAGDLCFIADAGRLLRAFDLARRPPAAVYEGEAGSGMGIDLRADILCLAASKKGLSLLRFTRSGDVEPLGSCATGGEAWDVWVQGDSAYVANVDVGLAVVDISDPARPRLSRSLRWSEDRCTAEIVRGEKDLLAVAAGPQGLFLYRIERPGEPVLAGKFQAGGESCAEGLAVRGGLVYLASGDRDDPGRNGLLIVDARDPAQPRLLGKVPFSGWVEGVCLHGDIAYVANTHAGVRAIDVADPARPRLLNGPPPMTREEKEAIDVSNGILRKVLSGEAHLDQSAPASAYLTLLHAVVKNDMALYRQVNPLHWKALKDQGKDLSDLRGMRQKPPMEICQILGDSRSEEGAFSALVTGFQGQPFDVHVFAFHRGRWRKLYNLGRLDDSWRQGAPRAFEEMKKILAEKIRKEF